MTRIVRLSQTEIENKPASRMRLDHQLEALRERAKHSTGLFFEELDMRKRRKRISGFDISIGWRHWDYYSPLSKWVFSVHSSREPSDIAQPSKPSPIRYVLAGVTFLGLYTEIERHNMGKIEIGTVASVLPFLIEAEFIKASKDSVFYCWIKASDGVTHAMTELVSHQLARRGGKGAKRFEAWIEAIESKGNGSSQPNRFEGQWVNK